MQLLTMALCERIAEKVRPAGAHQVRHFCQLSNQELKSSPEAARSRHSSAFRTSKQPRDDHFGALVCRLSLCPWQSKTLPGPSQGSSKPKS